ncbi:hypothetical protein D6850_03630 [Roseovarius spongiae]|uniref:Uncharacterized protein n=1 Tax=Roseovarius spongiae TaxID=2320272 RepID=A0A3A8B6F5_9RHOB|nr:hypothetical protein [Roseovarius spongiae]RKF16645.1 hypothetical protein D6850_03630 [Roseovarius spongiae]
MDIVIWSGAALSLAGLAGLCWCILRVWRAKRAGLGNEEMRAILQGVVPLNTAALLLSVLGLIVVVVGILLG